MSSTFKTPIELSRRFEWSGRRFRIYTYRTGFNRKGSIPMNHYICVLDDEPFDDDGWDHNVETAISRQVGRVGND
jgi:hypothetical protein